MAQIDDDALRLLSEQERAALQEEYDPEAENAAALAAVKTSAIDTNGDDGDGKQAGDKPDAQDEQGEVKTGQVAPTGAKGETGSTTATAEQTYAQDPSTVAYEATLPTDYDAQVQANKDARKALRAKFDDGDFDQTEFDAQSEKLDDERLGLVALKQRADIAQEMNQQAVERAWGNTIQSFMKEAASTPAIGVVDYIKDVAKQKDLDHFVRALGSVPGNENKPMRWYLDEAHKRVVALHNIPVVTGKTDAKRMPDTSRIPLTLADAPGAAGQDPMADEFSAIDKLSGADAERAYAQLSPEKQRAYLMRS